MLKVYIDDCGIGMEPVYVLAGGMTDAKTWAEFSEAWNAVLWMRPRIRYFKYQEARGFDGEFYGISAPSRNEKLRLLFKLLIEYKIEIFASVLPHNVFKEFYSELADTRLSSAYVWLLLGIVRRIIGHARMGRLRGPIDFIFDNQPGQAERTYSAWKEFTELSPAKFKKYFRNPPNFQDDKNIVALQAADYLAGIVRSVRASLINHNHMPMAPWGGAWEHFTIMPFIFTREQAQITAGALRKFESESVASTLGGTYQPIDWLSET